MLYRSRKYLLLFGDIIALYLVFYISFFLRFKGQFHPSIEIFYRLFPVIVLIYLFSFYLTGLYRKRFLDLGDLLKRILSSVFLASAFFVCFLYVFRSKWGAFPSSVILISAIIFAFYLFILRLILYKKTNSISIQKLFIDKKFFSSNWIEKIKDYDELVIAEDIRDLKEFYLLIQIANSYKLKISVLPQFYESIIQDKLYGRLSDRIPISIYTEKGKVLQDNLIRFTDIIISSLLFAFTLPLQLLISLGIKLDSPGPILYKQKRIGKDGKIFTLYKFRTMVFDAEEEIGPVLASPQDPRVTKIGRFLRKAGIDELPQLFNVLKGDMSMVGPRPERPFFALRDKALQGIRLCVKPGLTGFAQIRSFYDLKPAHKLKYDRLYIEKRSLWLYFYILFKTIPALFTRKGW